MCPIVVKWIHTVHRKANGMETIKSPANMSLDSSQNHDKIVRRWSQSGSNCFDHGSRSPIPNTDTPASFLTKALIKIWYIFPQAVKTCHKCFSISGPSRSARSKYLFRWETHHSIIFRIWFNYYTKQHSSSACLDSHCYPADKIRMSA